MTEPSEQPDGYFIPHRKNAAEWVMWVVIVPLVVAAQLLECLRRRRR